MKIDAHRLKTLRETRGWSQEHLATVAGISPRTVQRLEAGGEASRESRMALAAALGVEPAGLLESGAAANAGETGQADRARTTLWIVSIVTAVVMFMLVFGYVIGKDMAKRDNSRHDNQLQAACQADPTHCHQ